MGPQFVDFNGDGHVDIVTATFDGSPYLARGGVDGFAQPEAFRDTEGRRLLLGKHWDYDSESWENAERPDGGADPKDQCISAVAFDWDDDGDLDLILGEYKQGRLYLQLNEGTRGEPRFRGVNLPIDVNGAEHGIDKGMTAPQLVDWDGDGLMDLIVGGFGDVYGLDGNTGGVWLLAGEGEVGDPEFGMPLAMIDVEPKSGAAEPRRPEAGLYANAVDYDGDGDLDLLVGGYGMWAPPQPVLTPEQEARADQLAQQIGGDEKARIELLTEAVQGQDDVKAASSEARKTEAYRRLAERLSRAREELETLRPSEKREAAVWLYEWMAG